LTVLIKLQIRAVEL